MVSSFRYSMHTSAGFGGYCDCGDVEAWAEGTASCDKHKATTTHDEDDTTMHTDGDEYGGLDGDVVRVS